jgi:hypothetical protein
MHALRAGTAAAVVHPAAQTDKHGRMRIELLPVAAGRQGGSDEALRTGPGRDRRCCTCVTMQARTVTIAQC